uniref:Mannosyl-oligosaccharide glucosidase n=1 Tax=Tabanus bromius TaxID=304241 RepID=A0A0K8TMY1_TABBR
MARQRKNAGSTSNLNSDSNKKGSRQNKNGTSSSSASSATTTTKARKIGNRFIAMTQWRVIFGCSALLIASYFGYIGYLETRVNTPFDNQKMVQRTGLNDPERYWGSYRPGTYFGLKTRDPHSLVMGMMWYSPHKVRSNGDGIRHWCELGDNLQKYGWIQHDGKNFGYQEIHDYPLLLTTSFIKFPGKQYGGDWTARISVANKNPQRKERVGILWYVALDEKTDGDIWTSYEHSETPQIMGESVGLGVFKLSFHKVNGTVLHTSYARTFAPSLQYLRETIRMHLNMRGELFEHEGGLDKPKPNFIAVQFFVEAPFVLDISYQSRSGFSIVENIPEPSTGDAYTKELNNKQKDYSAKFESIFGLKRKGYGNEEILFAQAALSNMVGGIGYFYGSSRVQSTYTKEPVPYWKAPLYTGVPSRSFFPRGFLWDEGFHGLLITDWDIDIELDIICHWFDLMNVEGWIPREQILGVESLAKVPEEFVTQRNTNANPPTFFITLKKILTKYSKQLTLKGRLSTLERLYPRLQTWFAWYNSTQKGDLPGTYRWRGRDEKTQRELNPKTLTSGLDDYPRASHPTSAERHVDLHCWIAYAAGVMADLSHILGRDDTKYRETFSYLSDNLLLNRLYLSPYTETYSDWGLHTDSVVLKYPPPKKDKSGQWQQSEMIRVILKEPEQRFVDSTFGYVSLFPFLLELLESDSQHLQKVLKDLRNPNLLWTDYGLRSLSKTSPLYMTRNTEHDPPYWRGQIWININYLALKALYHYGSQPGPYTEEAQKIYVELRQNLVTNIFKQYKRTGYIWEQYNDRTGEGSGCHPFTGWSALVVLMMSEQY